MNMDISKMRICPWCGEKDMEFDNEGLMKNFHEQYYLGMICNNCESKSPKVDIQKMKKHFQRKSYLIKQCKMLAIVFWNARKFKEDFFEIPKIKEDIIAKYMDEPDFNPISMLWPKFSPLSCGICSIYVNEHTFVGTITKEDSLWYVHLLKKVEHDGFYCGAEKDLSFSTTCRTLKEAKEQTDLLVNDGRFQNILTVNGEGYD